MLAGASCLAAGYDKGPTDVPPTLQAEVEAFFRTDAARDRGKLAASIADKHASQPALVARAVEHANAWSELPHQRGKYVFDSPPSGIVTVEYALPDDYAPTRRTPLLVCTRGASGDADATFALVEALLGPSVRAYVRICVDNSMAKWHFEQPPNAGNLRLALLQARKMIRVDAERAFLFGVDEGADGAWLAAMSYPDLFAGAIVVDGYPHVPYAEQIYPLLLENLRALPILAVWHEVDGDETSGRGRVVAVRNRGIVEYAAKTSLPITGLELPAAAQGALPRGAVTKLLEHSRQPGTGVVSHWFRYAAQGRSHWLIQTAQDGDVWTADQISILAASSADRDSWIRQVLLEKLGYLGGRVNENIITIEAHGSARIEVDFEDGMVDWGKPVTIVCNGRRRDAGVIAPSVVTMLNHAYETWDFQRPVFAKLSIPVRGGVPVP